MVPLPIIQAALCRAIAIPESEPLGPPPAPPGSGYNKLVGGGTFSGFAEFPQWDGWTNPRDGSKSHAAGRSQWQPATWAFAAPAVHAIDFGPQAQDAATWWLADYLYHQHTKRDLYSDLASAWIQDVPTALVGTWPTATPDAFPAHFAQALKEQLAVQPPPPSPAPGPFPTPVIAPGDIAQIIVSILSLLVPSLNAATLLNVLTALFSLIGGGTPAPTPGA